jgi:hypothetical protein
MDLPYPSIEIHTPILSPHILPFIEGNSQQTTVQPTFSYSMVF